MYTEGAIIDAEVVEMAGEARAGDQNDNDDGTE